MPLPLAPIASVALRNGALALAGLAVARALARKGTSDTDPQGNSAAPPAGLDDLADGIGLAVTDAGDGFALRGRWRRVLRLGRHGPGLEIDVAGFGRMKIGKARS